MNTLRLILDGRLLEPTEHSSLDEADITIRRNDEDGSAAYSFSNTIAFYGQAFDYLREVFFESPTARINSVTVDVLDTCCGNKVLLQCRILWSSLEWCEIDEGVEGPCTISATLEEANDDTQAYLCMKGALMNSNAFGIQDRDHPFVRYCNDAVTGDSSYIIRIIFGAFVIGIGNIVLAIAIVFVAIAGLVSRRARQIRRNMRRLIQRLNNEFADRLIGCGFGQPAPYLRDLLTNACQQCNLTLSSTILSPGSRYYNTAYLFVPNEGGRTENTPEARAEYWELNANNKNAIDFLNEIKGAYNADYRISGGVLFFERKDFFQGSIPSFDLTNPELRKRVNSLCLAPSGDTAPQVDRVEAQFDPVELLGNTNYQRNYTALISYEPPPNPNLRGERLRQLPYASARRKGGIDGIFDAVMLSIAFIIGIISGGAAVTRALNRRSNIQALALSYGLASIPKLLVIDQDESGPDGAYVVSAITSYNRPYYAQEIYNAFFAWESPLEQAARLTDYTCELQYFCDELPENLIDLLDSYIQVRIMGEIRTGTIDEVTLGDGSTLTLKGRI